jgi:hypothetical protein
MIQWRERSVWFASRIPIAAFKLALARILFIVLVLIILRILCEPGFIQPEVASVASNDPEAEKEIADCRSADRISKAIFFRKQDLDMQTR